jgi:hypothetical protein
LAFFGPDQAGFGFLFQALRIAFDVDNRGQHRVAEDFVPLTETAVRDEDERAFFVAVEEDDLEKQKGSVPVNGDVADLVDNEQLRPAVELDPVPRGGFRRKPW